MDFYYLWAGEREKMIKFSGFASFAALKGFAKNTDDKEMMGKINIVEAYKRSIPSIIEKIKRRCKNDPKTADYIFTTTHKAKGLEWKTVILCTDFTEISGGLMSSAEQTSDLEDEKNILYVAMTRAKEYLALNFSVFDILVTAGEYFEKVVSMKQKKLGQAQLECVLCHDNLELEENVLGLESRKIRTKRFQIDIAFDHQGEPIVTENQKQVWKRAGLFCSVCATSPKISDAAIGKVHLLLFQR